MFKTNKLIRNLKMKKSIIILVFVFVLAQLGNASSTIENVPSINGETELPKPDVQGNTIVVKDDSEENKKPVVLLVPVESTEEIYGSHDEEEEEEEEEEENTTEEVEDVTHHGHKTKRCKSPSSFRTARRIPSAKGSRKYISASTESSIDESVEDPIGGTSLFRVASVKDAKQILKNLLKSRSTNQDNVSLERVSKPQKQDSIKLVSKNSNRQDHKPKKYVCYCVEEDCGMKRPGKKPSRTYAVKKKIGPNVHTKSSTNNEARDIRGPGRFHSGDVLGAPNNLKCPPGAILMEEPEYLARLAINRRKQNSRHRPAKNCPETMFPPDLEAQSLEQPTKIHIPLAGDRKWNRRVYKVDRKSPFAQKLQSVFEQRDAQDRVPCPEPESTYNVDDQQGLQDYYNEEQANYNQYNQIPVDPNLIYPSPYAVYPQYPQDPQYPQYPQYDDGLQNPIPMGPSGQDFVGRQEPSDNRYMPTPLGRNFIDINQCIKLFGPNFCIVTTTTISPLPGPHYANNCGGEHKQPGMVGQWQDDTRYSTRLPQQKSSKYSTSTYSADKSTTDFNGLGVTRPYEENILGGEGYPEDDSEERFGDQISSRPEYDHVTTSPYYNEPINLKIQANDKATQPENYETTGLKHENPDFGDYDNLIDPESPIRHDHTNSEYLVPIEDSYNSDLEDYFGSLEETNKSNVLQKMSDKGVTEGPIIAVTKKLQGAHKMSSPQYVQYTVKPVKGISTSSIEDTSDETFEDTSEYIQATQNSRLSDYDRSEFRYSTSELSNSESAESSTELPSHSVFSTIDRPEDESALRMESQDKNESPDWQRVTTMYPMSGNEDRTATTSFRVHDSKHQSDVYGSTVPDQVRANLGSNTPKTTNAHRQFVAITQSTPVNHYSEPDFISSTTIGSNNYYSSTHAAEGEPEVTTTYSMAANEPTESRLGDTVNKYSTTKAPSYVHSKQPKSRFGSAAGKTTTSYEKLVGRPQTTAMDIFGKPGMVSSSTVNSDNQYTTSYASTVDSKYRTTSLLRANEPEEQKFSSTTYPTTDAEVIGHDSSEYEVTSVETPSSLYTSQSENDKSKGKYITTERNFYPQEESYRTTFLDSSTQPEQVGDSLETNKISSHQPFVDSITQSTPSNTFEEAEDILNEATSHATMENSEYDTTPLLIENEPEQNVFTSDSPYSTTMFDEDESALSRQQVSEEHNEVSTEEIPSTLHYTTHSKMPGMDRNKWTNPEEVTNSHGKFVGITQSTPVNHFSQTEEASSATINSNNYYTTSYATMKDTDDSKTTVLGAKEPGEKVLSSTTYAWPQENEEKHQDNIEKTTRTQYYPTQSEMRETSRDQHFTTDQYSHSQFVGSHQSTLVDSSTRQNRLEENFEAHKTSTHQPFTDSTGQLTSSNDFAKTESILDAATSYATMADSRYDTTPSLGATEPREPLRTTVDSEGDTTIPLRQQKTEKHDEDGTEEISSSDYYTTQSKISGADQKKWSQAGKTTSSHRQYVGVTQPQSIDDSSQPEDTSTPTYGVNDGYTTSYATMEDIDSSTTTLLGEKEPEEEIFKSTTYPTIQEKHQNNIEETTWTQYYPSQSEMQENQHFTTDKNSYPQLVGLHQSTLADSSTTQDQLSENFETRKTSLHQPFGGNIAQSTSSNDFATSKDISDATTSYAAMKSSKYETTPLLGETEPEEGEFTSYAPYSTTTETEGDTSVSSWLQNTNERDEISTEKGPSTLHYSTYSKIADTNGNKWTKLGKMTSSHPQFIGITQSTPVDNFSQFGVVSSATIGSDGHKLNSYATMADKDQSTTSVLEAEKPEEEMFSSTSYSTIHDAEDMKTTYSRPEENEETHHDNVEETTWSQYLPTQSGMQETGADQHFTTDKHAYPQFVGSHQSTVAHDSTQQGQLNENWETPETNSQQPTVGEISQFSTSNDFSTTNDISDAATSYATMDNSRYDTTPLLGATEPEEREYSSYSPYSSTINPEGDTTASTWLQKSEARDGISTEKIPSTYYNTHSQMTGMDQNKWTKAEKTTSSHPRFVGITQSTPVNNFSPSAVVSSSRIRGNNHYTTSYATMENSKHDTTPILGTTEPEERDFTSYPTTTEHEGDTTASSWLQNTEERVRGKITSSRPQFVGVTQSSPVDDFSQTGLISSSTIGGNSPYSTSYATMENSKYDTTPLLGATEPEERDFTSYSSYPTTNDHGGDTTASASLQNTEDRVRGKVTSSHPQFIGVTQSTPVDDVSQAGVVSSSTVGGNSHYSTSYATMENSKYDTTPLLGATEPEERDFTSYSSYPTTNDHGGDTTASAWLQNTEERVRGKMTSSHPQFIGVTQSSPVDDFSQAGVVSSSTIGGNSHYSTSYATMENSKYDTTPLLGATEPEERDFTSYSSYPTTNDYEDDTTASSWLQNTEEQVGGKVTSSRPQFVRVTQSSPVDAFSQAGVVSSSTIGGNSHYSTSYATMENSKHDTTPLLGATEPEGRDITSYSSYPTTTDHEGDTTASSWLQNTEERVRGKVTSSRPQFVGVTQSSPVDDFSQVGVASSTTIGSNSHYTTSYPTMEDMGHSKTSVLGAEEPEEEIFRSTTYPTPQYFTTERNSHPQFSTEAPEDITVGNNAEQFTNWHYSTAYQKATSQSAHSQFVTSHHSTTAPRFEPDSGIREESNAYFTSKAYDDNNVNPVTGPDSYFEGEGIKNWNDFTSMSSDFRLGDANKVEEIEQPTTINLLEPKKEGWESTEISPHQFTDYEVVGRKMPYKESTMNDDFSQTSEDDLSSTQITQRTNAKTHNPYLGQSYENALSTSSSERAEKEEVGKPIYKSVSSTPTTDTHFVESHSADPKILKSENKILEPFSDGTSSPSNNYHYTNEYSTLDESPTTEFSKYLDDASLQPVGNTLRNEPSINKEVTSSSINYGDYISSEDDLPSRSSESVATPKSKTPSNLLRSSTTIRSVNYEDYRNSVSTQEPETYPSYSEDQTTPMSDSSEEISSEDQLSPEEKNILRTTVEKVVKDLISAKSDNPDKDSDISPEVVGAPLHPGLPELPILKNLFSLPEVRNMAIGTVKGLMSEVSGVPQASSLGRLADHLIDSVMDGVVNNLIPGPVTTPSSGNVDEHRYENGQWTVVPVTLVPKDDQVGQKLDGVSSTTEEIVGRKLDKLSGATEDIVGQKPEDKVLNTIKDIVGRPGIGLQGARLPLVQNIIVRAVENTLRNAKQIVNHSVIWDTLNDVIARAEKSLLPTHGTTTTAKTTTKSVVKTTTKSSVDTTTRSRVDTTIKSSRVKTPGGPFKIAPIIPVTEHVFKDGKWAEKQTILGARKKNFESTIATTVATNNHLRTSPSSYESPTEPENESDYSTKALDYALMGESEEDSRTQEYDSSTGIVGITKEIPKNIKSHHGDEDGLDNSPTKYFSPKDRILSYIKNHQTPAGVVGSQDKWQTTSDSSNSALTENYATSTESASNQLTENTENSAEFAQATKTNDSGFSTESTESSDGSSEETTCTCAKKKKMKKEEDVASVLRGSTEASTEEDNYSEVPSTIYESVEEGNSLTTLQTRKNSGEQLVSTESSEFSSTIHHLDVDQDQSNDYTTEEDVANEPPVTEELGKNTAEDSQDNSEEAKTSYITTDSTESSSISNTEVHTKNIQNQITSTPVFVYGEPVGSTQFSEGPSRSGGQTSKSTDGEFIGGPNEITTESSAETSDLVGASEKVMNLNETPSVSDITEQNLGGDNHKHNDEIITTPIYVYGTPVHGIGQQATTNYKESTTENQFSKTSEHRSTASILTDTQENIGDTNFPGSQTTESYSDTGSDKRTEYSTENYIKMENALTTDNSGDNSEYEVSTEAAKSNESFSDVTNDVLQAENRNIDNDSSTRVYVNGEPLQETTTQTLSRKQPKISKSYVSAQEATTSSQGLIGASRTRNGRPQLPSAPRERLHRPRDDILKGPRIPSGGTSNCMTPKYDPTYFGKISLNGLNPGGEKISDLTNTDLFYVGDGVKIPLTIRRMPDGSYALSISEKICENFVKRKCPCCVPRDGDIVEERRQSHEADEYSVETSSKEDYNNDSFEPTESAEFQGKSKKRYVRSTSGSEVVVTSATPVKNFVKKYNLTLDLDKTHDLIQRNNEDAKEMRNTRRKTRLSSSRDAKLRNLYGNNNEIQRDDSEEIENRIVDTSDSDTVSKESNSIRKAEYVFDTDTNDFIQSLLHIKDAPEEKRTEIVLNALDGLVNAGQNPGSMDRNTFGDAAEEIPSEDENPWAGSDEYDLNEMENEMARYGYQKDNPILERIRFIKAQQNSHGQYKYQKNIDHRAKGKMNMLKTVLHWLRQVFLETNVNNKN